MTISQAVEGLDCRREIMDLGERYGKEYHRDGSGIMRKDTIAYYGCGMYDLIQKYGEEKAAEMFREQERKAFLPTIVMTKILENIGPDVVVVTTSPRMEKAAGIAAEKRKIPVVRINDLPVTEQPGYACTMCVMNEWARQYAVNVARHPAERVVVTGQPVFEEEMSVDERELERVSHSLQTRDFDHVVCFFTSNGQDETAVLRKVKEIAGRMPETLFIIKLHPNQDIREYRYTEQKNVVLRKDSAIFHIHLCDLAITTFSTTGIETALLDKPLIELNFTGRPYAMDYSEMGIAALVDDLNKLEPAIRDLLDSCSLSYRKLKQSRKWFKNGENARESIGKVILHAGEGYV